MSKPTGRIKGQRHQPWCHVAAASCRPARGCRCRHGSANLDIYAGKFARSGFRGPLNYYSNVDRNWELMAAFEGIKVAVPALYVAGDHDLVIAFPGAASTSPI
jgi:hypothetical protein